MTKLTILSNIIESAAFINFKLFVTNTTVFVLTKPQKHLEKIQHLG